MLSCFPCGRSSSVSEPTATTSIAHKCSPSSEEAKSCPGMNKDQLLSAVSCSLTAGVKTCLTKMGSLTVADDAKDMHLFSFSPQMEKPMRAMVTDGNTIGDGLATERDFAHPPAPSAFNELNLQKEEEKQLVISSIVLVKDGHTQDEYSPKDVLVSSILSMEEDGYIPNKELADEKNMKLSGKQEICFIKAISEEGRAGSTIGNTCVEWEADASKAENDANFDEYTQVGEGKKGVNIVPHAAGDGGGYYSKGGISQNKTPTVLFSYGISDQQRDFMFLCAGLVVQAVGFQLKSIVEVITMLILLGYRTYLFASRLAHSLVRAKKNLADMQAMLLSRVATENIRLVLPMEKWETMKPKLIAGAKKMGWGCLNAAYVITMLSVLVFISFFLSYCVVLKGGSTQKPIHITKELYFDYTKSHPVASLDLYSLDAYIRMINASKGIKVPHPASLRFRATFLLTLPESDYNRNLGVFQVTSELLSKTGEILVKASQPCMLHFKSDTVHYVKSICMAIPLLTGIASETQILSLHLLDWQQDVPSPIANVLRIFLIPRAGRALSAGLPELYKAEVQVDSLQDPWMPSSSSSSIRTLVMWIWLSILVFGCLSSFCMYMMHHSKNTS